MYTRTWCTKNTCLNISRLPLYLHEKSIELMLSVPPLLILICPMSNFTRMYFILSGPLQIVFERTFHLLSNLLKLFNIFREFHRVFPLWSRTRSLSLYSVRLLTCTLAICILIQVCLSFKLFPACLSVNLSHCQLTCVSSVSLSKCSSIFSTCLHACLSAFVFICLVCLCLSLSFSICLSVVFRGKIKTNFEKTEI
jgi:hypothetical protein